MGSIPLVALDSRPPADAPDLLGEYGKLQSMRHAQAMAPLEQQQAQQQIQNSQLQGQGLQQENEMRQRQIQDTQTLEKLSPQFIQKDANGKVIGYDYGGFFGSAASSGVSPQTLLPLQKSIYETTTAKANSGEAQLKLESSATQQAFEHIEGLRGTQDTAQRQQLWNSSLQWAQKNAQLLGIDASQLPQQAPDDNGLTSIEAGLGMHAQMIDNASKLAAANKSELDQEAEQQRIDFYKSNGGAEGISVEAQQQADWLSKHPGKGPSDYAIAMKKLVPAYNFSLQQSAGNATQPLNAGQQATVSAILEGRINPPSSFALKTPYWQNIMANVFEKDPQFSEQRAQLRKDFTVGKHSTEINSINTALVHVGVLNDAIDAMNNGNIQVLNKISNELGAQVGSDKMTTFNTIVHRVGPEISKAYIGSGGSAGERGADEKDFDPKLGPQQLKSNAAMTAQLLRSKISSLENQWNQNRSDAMPEFQQRFITPQAQQVLQKLNPQQSAPQVGQRVKLKNGQTITVKVVHPDGSFD